MPTVTGVMKYIGAVYILYLAFHIAEANRHTVMKKNQLLFLKGL